MKDNKKCDRCGKEIRKDESFFILGCSTPEVSRSETLNFCSSDCVILFLHECKESVRGR